MSGMTTTGSTSVSNYGNRTVEIEVTGICRQDIMKTSNYKVKVPYNRMLKTLQNIYSMGGKVANVTLLSAQTSEASE